MTTPVDPDFKFKKASELQPLTFDKRPVGSLTATLSVDQWTSLLNEETALFKKELQEDVSSKTLPILPLTLHLIVETRQGGSGKH